MKTVALPIFMAFVLLYFTGCSNTDDQRKIASLEARLSALEAKCGKMETNIDGLFDVQKASMKVVEAQVELDLLNVKH